CVAFRAGAGRAAEVFADGLVVLAGAVLAGAALVVFAEAPFLPFAPADFFATTLTGLFGASFSSIASSSVSCGLTEEDGVVSPKWIGAVPPPEPLPDPKPSTVQTAGILDFGGGSFDKRPCP